MLWRPPLLLTLGLVLGQAIAEYEQQRYGLQARSVSNMIQNANATICRNYPLPPFNYISSVTLYLLYSQYLYSTPNRPYVYSKTEDNIIGSLLPAVCLRW